MESPFHRGEQEVQARAGVREEMEAVGQRIVRDFMPDQHRALFAGLPFVVLGGPDLEGALWATLRAGPPGFVSSPDPRSLRVDASPPPGDPLVVREGLEVGLLGIEPQTRRRNRMNGPVVASDGGGFTVRVAQSFGNCPRFITRRHCQYLERAPGEARRSTRLDGPAQASIERAEPFFIASDSGSTPRGRATGADVSHRGGPPGFVHVDSPTRLTWPDYAGNDLFNTLGN